jgi:hypothetical protein
MRILVITLTCLFLIFAAPGDAIGQKVVKIARHHPSYVKKKHHTFLYRLLYTRRDRRANWNSGHTEFKNRTRRDQKRLSRHHILPTPESEYKRVVKKTVLKDMAKTDTKAGENKEKTAVPDMPKDKEPAKEPDKPKDPDPDKPKDPPADPDKK